MTSRPTLLLVAVLGVIACRDAAGPVRFGMAGPFDEGFGEANRRGAELAAAEINAAGGIGGDSLVLEFANDSGDGARAAAIAQAFVDSTYEQAANLARWNRAVLERAPR